VFEDILWKIQINVVFVLRHRIAWCYVPRFCEKPCSLVLCTEVLQELLDPAYCTLMTDTVGLFDTLILEFTASYSKNLRNS